jgi:hypothetical protein
MTKKLNELKVLLSNNKEKGTGYSVSPLAFFPVLPSTLPSLLSKKKGEVHTLSLQRYKRG